MLAVAWQTLKGLAIYPGEVLDQRLVFDLAAGTCKTMVMEVKTTR